MKQFILRSAPSAIALSSLAFVDKFRKSNPQSVQCTLDFVNGDFKYVCSPIVIPTSSSNEVSGTEFLPSCAGTCNSHDDCPGGMQCWTQQIEGDVPGCPGYPVASTGVCYEASQLQIVSCTTAGGGVDNEQNNVLLENCQGHCRTDLDCAIGLSCFQPGDLMEVPGCAGISEEGVAYCFNSNSSYSALQAFQPTAAPSWFAASSFPTEILSLDQFERPSSVPVPSGTAAQPTRVYSNSSLPDTPNGSPRDPISSAPNPLPSATPNKSPSRSPSVAPSNGPSRGPTPYPSPSPSVVPSSSPITIPSESPSAVPSVSPSAVPSDTPSIYPTRPPSSLPSSQPTKSPSSAPSNLPSTFPSTAPTEFGVWIPDELPVYPHSPSSSNAGSDYPSLSPTLQDGSWNPNELPVYPHSPSSSNAGSDYPSLSPKLQDGAWNPNELPRDPHSPSSNLHSDYPSLSPTLQDGAWNPNELPVYPHSPSGNAHSDYPSSSPTLQDGAWNPNELPAYPHSPSNNAHSDYPSLSPTLQDGAWNPNELPANPQSDLTEAPSKTASPSFFSVISAPSAICTSNPACAARGLFGFCCPTTDGIFLDCCSTSTPESPTSLALSDFPSVSPTKNQVDTSEILLSDRPSDSPTEFGAWNPDEDTGALNTPPSPSAVDLSDTPSSTPTKYGVDPNDITLTSDTPSTTPTEFGVRAPGELNESSQRAPSDFPSSQPSNIQFTMLSDAPSAVPSRSSVVQNDVLSDSPSMNPTKNDVHPYETLASDPPSSSPIEFGAWDPNELPGAPQSAPSDHWFHTPTSYPALVAPGLHSDAPSSVPSTSRSVVNQNLSHRPSSAGPSPSVSDAPSSGPIEVQNPSEGEVVDENEVDPSVSTTSSPTQSPAPTGENSTSCSHSDPGRELQLAMAISSLLGSGYETSIDPVIKDPSRAEYHAFEWIVNLDTMMLCPDSSHLHQRFILALLYIETGGVNWSICTESNHDECDDGEPFMSGAHECRWVGIDCNIQRQVTGIHLDKSNLVGNLPSQLGDLGNLVELVMDDNSITGGIPTTFGKLASLQVIDLDSNKLSGEIPLELYNASSLRVLDLDSNLLTGVVSPLMGQQWPNLYFVQLDKNAFTGRIPSELATLSDLRYLSMFMNGFSEPMPLELCQRDDVTLYADCDVCRTTDSCCTACLNQE
jgi:hypothetical protein